MKNINEPTRDSLTKEFHGTAALVGSLVGWNPNCFFGETFNKIP